MGHAILGGTFLFSFFLSANLALGASEFLYKQSPDLIYFTLKPYAPLQGDPVLASGNEAEYLSNVFRTALREGHRLGTGYMEDGLPGAYYAFLVASLQVPEHESRWQQVRRISQLGNRCSKANNSGERVRAVSSKAFQTFRQAMQSSAQPLVGECRSYDPDAEAVQLLGSHDALSTGYMQMTMNWHPAHYTSGNFLHARAGIADGMKYFQIGFQSILRNPRKYPCVVSGRDSREPMNYVTLVRAAWAGNYNSGNVSQSCRFVNDPSSPWVQGNDMPYKENLEDLLAGRDMLANHLQGDDLEALRELVARFKGEDIPTPRLAMILSTQIDVPGAGGSDHPIVVPPSDELSVQTLARGELVVQSLGLNARKEPNAWAPLITTLIQGAVVRPISMSNGWAEIQIGGRRAYVNASYLARRQPYAMKGKVSGASFVNLRESPPRGQVGGIQTRGKVVTILGTQKIWGQEYPWYQVESPWNTPGEKSYWVYGHYLQISRKIVALVRVPE